MEVENVTVTLNDVNYAIHADPYVNFGYHCGPAICLTLIPPEESDIKPQRITTNIPEYALHGAKVLIRRTPYVGVLIDALTGAGMLHPDPSSILAEEIEDGEFYVLTLSDKFNLGRYEDQVRRARKSMRQSITLDLEIVTPLAA